MTTTKTQNTLGLNITPVAYRWKRDPSNHSWQYSKRVPRITYKLGELKMKGLPNIAIEGLYSQEHVQKILNTLIDVRNMLTHHPMQGLDTTVTMASYKLEGLLHDAN